MRKFSAETHHQIYFSAGVIAAHANWAVKGFRQKDVRFYIELFSNWMEATLEGPTIPLHNVQISRFLSRLVAEGFCRKKIQGTQPYYRLTRAGIVGLLSEMVGRECVLPIEQFFFLHYIVDSYGKLIVELVEREGVDFPRALKIELESLQDPKHLVQRQRRFIAKEISKLELREKEALAASELARQQLGRGKKVAEVVAAVQERFPYELNNQKPLRELFLEIPDEKRRWELEEGAYLRGALLWRPMREFLVSYQRILGDLEKARG